MSAIPDRKSAAVMFTDIVKATDMMAKDEEKALALLKEKRTILQPIIEKHDGIYVKGTGDGSLSYFDSPYKASLCAQIFQQNIYDRNDLNVRVGIHVGDIVFDEGDVYGDGVNVAKRLESMAPDGGICVSNSVYDELRNKKEFDGIDLGLQTLKGIGRLVEVFGLEGDKINAPNPNNYHENKVRVHAHDEVPSVAIIPFRNKGKEEEEFYAYGICSELISDVSSAGLIRVASLEKIMELGDLSASEKAEQLNVRYITTGMLWKMENMFQLSIELYDTKDLKVIWSDQWQEHWDNLTTIKGNLSAGLLKALNTKKSFEDKISIESTEAYTFYLEAKYKFDNLEKESEIEIIRGLLTKCLSLDEKNLDAKWLLAQTWFHADDHEKAEKLSIQIINEGEKTNNYKIVADVYWRLGHHLVLRRDFKKGKEYFHLSLEISTKINDKKNIAFSTCGLAWIYAEEGSSSNDEIIEMFKNGLSLFKELEDNTAGVGTTVDLGYYYGVAVGKIDKSLIYFNRALKLAEEFGSKFDWALAYLGIGFYHFFVGDYKKCDNYYNKSLELATEIGDKSLMSLMNQALGESLCFQDEYKESLTYFEKSYEIAIKINLKIWITGALQGIALCKQKLGLEFDYDTINLDREKRKQEEIGVRINAYYDDLLYYMIFKENKYLQSAYDKLNNISNKLNEEDRKTFLNCPWPKLVKEEWEKNNEL